MISFTGPDRHVQLVDLALPVHVLHLPHPLLADDVHLHGAGRRAIDVEEHLCAPDEHHHDDENGMNVQNSSSASEPWIGVADLVTVTPAVLDREGTTTSVAIRIEKNAVTATMKK
jgi:hypothetical protein